MLECIIFVCYHVYMKQIMDKDNVQVSQADKAYEYIRMAILNREFLPGHPLYETDLSEQLGMSRTPIREAINRLKAEGLLETVRRKGVTVKSLSKEEIRQTYEVAEGLEGMVAYLAALNANSADLKNLEKHVLAMEEALVEEDVDKWVSADDEFHKTLYPLCQNSYLIEAISRLYIPVHMARLMVTRNSFNKIASTKEHRQTYEAIRDGDAERARQVTQNHWKNVRNNLLSYILL